MLEFILVYFLLVFNKVFLLKIGFLLRIISMYNCILSLKMDFFGCNGCIIVICSGNEIDGLF